MSPETRPSVGMEQYVYNAMAKAHYQTLEDGTWYADIFICPGVWAIGETIQECRETLQDALADWLIAAYEGREPIPAVTELAWLNPRWHNAGD